MARNVCLYLHTHWDREWYRSFESYRYRLCQTLLDILNYLEADPSRVFMLDGQTVVLEDFLAVEPEHAARIKSLIQAGRLQVGPWYVLPDEFLVSGEALIRNLQLGTQQARSWGQNKFWGYLPDMFGHLAQMPLLLAQANLAPAIIWRGVNPDSAHFLWQALDGTRLPCIHLTRGYYQDALHQSPPAWDIFQAFLEAIDPATPEGIPLLVPIGADHMGLPEHLDEHIREAQRRFPDYQLELSDVATYIDQLDRLDQMKLTEEVHYGELHQAVGTAYVLPGVWSTRIYLKQANDVLQTLLERELEPLLVYQKLAGYKPATKMLWQAWKYLLQNHPHDSICGCSVDEVHQDMLPRFRWATEIAHELRSQVQQTWGGQVLGANPGLTLNLLNNSSVLVQGIQQVQIDFPAEDHVRYFTLLDEQGQSLEYEILKTEDLEVFVAEPDILPHWESVRRYSCQLWLAVPGLYCQSLSIIPHQNPGIMLDVPKAGPEQSIENNFCKVIWDPRSGQVHLYQKQDHNWVELAEGHIFVSEGDAGDSYNYSPPQEDQVVELTASSSRVAYTALGQKMYLNYYGSVPARLQDDRQRRAGIKVPLRIETVLSLYQDEERLHVQVHLSNQAKDHRLRLIWKTPFQNLRCTAGTAFGSMERKQLPERAIDVPPGQERQVEMFPFSEWIHLSEPNQGGWALQATGLHEASLIQWEGKSALSLTLLRAIGWLSRDDLRTRGGGAGPRMPTPEAQCLGEYVYHYVIHFCGPQLDDALARINALRFPLQIFQGKKPDLNRVFTLSEGPLLLSALTLSQDGKGIIVRLVNETSERQDFVLSPHFACLKIVETEPLERQETLLESDQCMGSLGAYACITFKFYLNDTDVSVEVDG